MKEASGALLELQEIVLNYCTAIENAQSEEEVEQLKAEFPNYLRENGYGEEFISQFMEVMERQEERVNEIIFNENGKVAATDEPIQVEETAVPTETPAPVESVNVGQQAALGFGIIGGLVVGITAVKKNILKHKKNKEL